MLARSVRSPSCKGERPATEAEVQVALIWQELLRTDMPARGSSFLSLGGNSLTAALAVTRLRTAFGVDLSVTEFLDGADLAEVAHGLQQRATLARLRAEPVDGLSETIEF
jgi:hypothetical protein